MFNGIARRTFGGLLKKDLRLNKNGRIVSIRKSDIAKRLYAERGGIRKKPVSAGKGVRDNTTSETGNTEGADVVDSGVPGKK